MGCGAQHTGCGGFEIGFESAVDCTDYADGQTANRIAVRKCRCWTAKPFPVQQPPLFDGKSSCCPATAAAVRPNRFLRSKPPLPDSKSGCCPGNAAAIRPNCFLRSNRRCRTVNPICCPGNAAAIQPNRFLRSNRRCRTANPVAAQEIPLRASNPVFRTAIAAAVQ